MTFAELFPGELVKNPYWVLSGRIQDMNGMVYKRID